MRITNGIGGADLSNNVNANNYYHGDANYSGAIDKICTYTGSVTTSDINGINYQGDKFTFDANEELDAYSMEIWTIRNSPMTGMRAPKKVYILGKNSDHSSDNNWTLLKEDDFVAWTDANEPSTSPYRTVINGQVYHAGRNIIINSNNKYRYYRLVVNTIYGGNDIDSNGNLSPGPGYSHDRYLQISEVSMKKKLLQLPGDKVLFYKSYIFIMLRHQIVLRMILVIHLIQDTMQIMQQ